jgi:hypothetical protein
MVIPSNMVMTGFDPSPFECAQGIFEDCDGLIPPSSTEALSEA